MKKLLIIFSLCAFAFSLAFSQDNQDNSYYTGDEATVVDKAQQAPPPLPTYVQPPCPAEGYMWEPGYWGWGAGGYYWVPGVWVMPPSAGLLWTPGYWGFYGGYYGWHHGYWGSSIGYYGGINYGFGYSGVGFYGGRWDGGVFRYNAAVWRVGGGFHNVYRENHSVAIANHASFNGPNGIRYRPSGGELQTMHGTHVERTANQIAHHDAAANDRGLSHAATHGQPAYHSMSKPGGQHFNARGHAVGGAPRGGGGGARSGGGGRR